MNREHIEPEHDEGMDGMEVSHEEQSAAPLQLDPQPKVTKLRGEIRMGMICLGAIILVAILFGIYYSGQKKQNMAAAASKPTAVKTAPTKDVDETIEGLEARSNGSVVGPGGVRRVSTDGSAISPDDPAASLDLPPAAVVQGAHRVGTGSVSGNNGSSQMTPKEKAAWDAYAAEIRARESSLETRGGSSPEQRSSNNSDPSQMAPADILGRELAAVQSGQYGGAGVGAGASAAGGTGRQDDQNGQGDKNTYAEQARSRKEDVSVHLSRQLEMTKYEIQAGWDIPATLEQGINSDLPGEVRGIVRENVYDSSSGHYLLIPQGSRVVGRYNSRISFGQSGIQVIWTRLIYPDGSSIELGGLNGQDARGLSGFRDRVDNHYARLIGDVLMSSALSAGVEIGANGGTTSNAATVLTPQQIATAALAQQLGEFGMEVARRDMNRQPTITIPIGYRFNIRVQKDLIFDSAYHDEAATWNR